MRFVDDRLVLLRVLGMAGVPLVTVLSVVLVVHAAVPAAMALALGAIVDRLVNAGTGDLFAAALVPLFAFGVVVLAGHVTDAAAKPLEFAARARIDGRHRARILALTTGVTSIGPLEDRETQELIRQTGAEPDHGVTTPADGALAQLRWFAGLAGAAVACWVLARYQWWLIPLLLVPSAIGLYLRSRQYFAAVRALQAAMREELFADVWRQAATSGAEGKDVRMFGFADWMVERMQRHVRAGNSPFWDHITGVAKQSWLQFSLALLGLGPAYVLVTLDAVRGQTSIAVQTAVLVAGWSLFGALGTSAGIYQMTGSAEVLRAFERLRERLGGPAAQHAEGGGVMPSTGRPPLVRFEGVSFRYPAMDNNVLDGLDLEIRPGELLALVGLNGAGKSTLTKLLAGLYTPNTGRITIDGTDLARIGAEPWRRRISVVFQDFVRYELPAIDNVTLGQAAVPADEAIAQRAAQQAGFDEVLTRLPDGWRTPLARSRTGGVDLSGGQWQQVVLARALYAVRQGAQLLVLDEPTAHLDVRTEFQVFHRLAQQRGDISVVLISHRLSTVRQADRIVLLDGGRITESGSHDELMALGGSYAKMFTLQSERFQAEAATEQDGAAAPQGREDVR